MQYGFGSGILYGIPSGANPTPVRFGALQDVSLDFAFNNKELYGQYQFPLAIARGTGKITGKAKFGQLMGAVFNDLFFSVDASAANIKTAVDEEGTVPGSSTYTITVTHASDFREDLGVRYAANGNPLTRVSAVSAEGQYSVNVSTGVYTFHADDASVAVKIDYTYDVTSTSAKVMTLSNQLIGVAPTFSILLTETFDGKQFTLKLHSCISSKLSLPTKMEDYIIQEMDFSAHADAAGDVFTLGIDE